jgi:hypothetical protein
LCNHRGETQKVIFSEQGGGTGTIFEGEETEENTPEKNFLELVDETPSTTGENFENFSEDVGGEEPLPESLPQKHFENREEENPGRHFGMVTRAEPIDETSTEENFDIFNFSPRALLTRRVLGLDKLNLLLDSGANEFMIKDKKFAKILGKREAKITTASESGPLRGGFYGLPKNFIFSDGRTEVGFGHENKAVFAEGLTDNLASVGRICENGFVIIFDANSYKILTEDKFHYGGTVVHKQNRDPHTGLYPLTIFKNEIPDLHNNQITLSRAKEGEFPENFRQGTSEKFLRT